MINGRFTTARFFYFQVGFMDYLRLPIGDDYPDSFNLIVEIPKGSANKYEYNKKLQVFAFVLNVLNLIMIKTKT